MKNIKAITILLAVFVVIASCRKTNFLESKAIGDLNEATVFTDSARTMAFLAGVYSSVGTSFNTNRFFNASYMDVTDETDPRYTAGVNTAQRFHFGTMTAADESFSNLDLFNFNICYQRIRQANLFISKLDIAPLPAALKIGAKAETRFLRAWYYAMLMKAFGGVQLVGDSVYNLTDEIAVPRSTYAVCVEYVVKELDEAANDLPLSYTGLDYGRATKGACLALKARVLLYAASPLFNGGSMATDEKLKALTAYPTADPQRWNRAAQASLDVINLGQYQLEVDNSKPGAGFYKLFLKRVNAEYIFAQMMGTNKSLESVFFPRDVSGNGSGAGYHWPHQNAVDRFGTANGKSIKDPASGYSDNKPYANRDPRFYYSIVYNGCTMYNNTGTKQDTVFTFVNSTVQSNNRLAANNTLSNDNTKTSYYIRKMCDTATAVNGGPSTERCNPLIRYAEVLLSYAEALNESGNSALAVDQIKKVRQRAGIKPGVDDNYGIPAGVTRAELRALIQNERSVELMFEEHRFWDVRRWKIAPQTETAELQGMKITRNPDKSYTYQRFKLNRQHYWPVNNSYYLMPYVQSEINKIPGVILQNPGW